MKKQPRACRKQDQLVRLAVPECILNSPIMKTPKKCRSCTWLSETGYCRMMKPHDVPKKPCAKFYQDPFKLKPGEGKWTFLVSPNVRLDRQEEAR